MITDLNVIVKEWAYRVHDGKPNPNNSAHLYHLSEILIENKWPLSVIDVLLQNLNEVDRAGQVWKTKKGNWRGERDDGTRRSFDNKDLTQRWVSGEEEPADDGDADGDTDTNDDLRNVDHSTTDKSLTRKTTDPSETGVGLGTNISRAGEAATHKALRMLKEGKSYKEIEKYLMSIANHPDTYLDKSWVKAAISATKSIEETFGKDNIDEIVWDTPSGRKLINVEGHGTSSDMFITLKDGKRVGISLKKDGKVFIRNGAYKKTTEKLYKDLEEMGVPTDEVKKFEKKTNIKNYIKDREKQIKSAVKKMRDDETVKSVIERVKTDPEYAATINLSDKYLNRLDEDFWDRVSGKSGKRTGDDIKLLARLSAAPEYREINPKVYQNLRDTDLRNTQRFLGAIEDSPEIETAIKKDVMRSIHIDQILGLDDDMNLDEFVTVYGTTPQASQLNEQSIINMFGGEVEQLVSQYKENPSEELKEQIKETIQNQIQIDYKDGAKDGMIKIKHEGPPPQEYSLFTIKARAKGIGALPTLEMAQTTFMSNALKFGLDIDEWPSTQRNAFLKSQV